VIFASGDGGWNKGVAGKFETFSHFVQQKYGMKRYESPILVGDSSQEFPAHRS